MATIIHHEVVGASVKGCLLPIGESFSKQGKSPYKTLKNVREGDVVRYGKGRFGDEYKVLDCHKVKIGSGEFRAWMRLFYPNWDFHELEETWREYCYRMGYGINGYSRVECLVILCK